MPANDNPKPFIPFTNIGNAGYAPVLREGGLTAEVINSGNLQLLLKFFNENASNLNRDEFEYLKARIATAREIERLNKKAMKDLSQGKDHPIPQTDETGGYTGFSNLTYPDHQTSSNGCWSCAYSLLLKSRGVDLSQEKIRAWRPDYAESEDARTPATQNLWYMRNADTAMEIPYNVDMLSQVVPNTAMVSLTLPPLAMDSIALSDPSTGSPVEMTAQRISDIRDHHKNEVIKTLTETISNAVKVDHSPVAVVVDGHYITITGIDKNGSLRYEDSVYEKGNTTHYMTVEQLYHLGHEVHQKQVDATTFVNVNPMGISLNWLQDLNVPQYSQGSISKPDYKDNNDVISVDAEGNVKIDVPVYDTFRITGGKLSEGNVTTQGVMSLSVMDTKALEKKLGCNVTSYGPDGGYNLGNLDTYYPSKVCAKNDPRLVKDQSLEGDRYIKDLGYELSRLAQIDFNGKPWALELEKHANTLIALTKKGMSPQGRKEAEESLKSLPGILCQKEGGKSILRTLFDEGYVLDSWVEKSELIRDLNVLNDKLGLGMDIAAAMGKPAGTVYTQGDARTDAEIDYYMYYLDPQKISDNKIRRVAAESALSNLISLMQLRKDKYADVHAYPPGTSEITVLKNTIDNTAAMDEIRRMGVENFLAMGTTPEEIYNSFRAINDAVFKKNMGAIAANSNKVASFKNVQDDKDDNDFSLFGQEKNDALRAKLSSFDEAGRSLFPVAKGNGANDAKTIEGTAAPDRELKTLRRVLNNGKNAKVSKKAYTDILKALDDFENSYKMWKAVNNSPYSNLESETQNTPYDLEMSRYSNVTEAISDVQQKTKVLSDTIDKYMAQSAGLKGNDEYKLVLESAKVAADNARIYMDDRQMCNDLDHVNNIKGIDIEVVRNKVNNEREMIEEQMLSSSSDRDKLFLFNKSEALFNISEVALKNGDNTLTEDEKQFVSASVGNLLFDKICEKFPEMKNKVNSPETQQQYDEAVVDIMTSNSFTELIRSMDREGLRHIISEKKGSEDLFKNFIKEEYMTGDEIKKLTSNNRSKTTEADKTVSETKVEVSKTIKK